MPHIFGGKTVCVSAEGDTQPAPTASAAARKAPDRRPTSLGFHRSNLWAGRTSARVERARSPGLIAGDAGRGVQHPASTPMWTLMKAHPAPPIHLQLRDALAMNAMRVIELFKSWDDDGDGLVARSEFEQGLRELGLKVRHQSSMTYFLGGTRTIRDRSACVRCEAIGC